MLGHGSPLLLVELAVEIAGGERPRGVAARPDPRRLGPRGARERTGQAHPTPLQALVRRRHRAATDRRDVGGAPTLGIVRTTASSSSPGSLRSAALSCP